MKLSVIYESEGLEGINVSPGLNPASTSTAPLAPRHDTGTSDDRYTQQIDRPDLDASVDTDGDYTDYDSDDYADEDDPTPGRQAASTPPIIARLTAALRAKGLLEGEIANVIALVEQHMHRHRVNTLTEELVDAIVGAAEMAVGPRGIRGVIERKLGDRIASRVRRKVNKRPQLRVPHPELQIPPHPEHSKLHEGEAETSSNLVGGTTNVTDQNVLGIAGHPVTPGLFNTTKYHLDTYYGTNKPSFDNEVDGNDDEQPATDNDTDARHYYPPVTLQSILGAVGDVVSDVGELIGSDQYYNVEPDDLPSYKPVREIDYTYDKYRSVGLDEIDDIDDIETEARNDRDFNRRCDVATLCEGLVAGSPQAQDEVWYQEYQAVHQLLTG